MILMDLRMMGLNWQNLSLKRAFDVKAERLQLGRMESE